MKFPGFLVPVRHSSRSGGEFSWPDAPVLATACLDDRVPLEQLRRTLREELRVAPRTTFNATGPCALRMRRDPSAKHPEGYRLAVTPTGIEISASTAAGAYYAIQTLREMIRMYGRNLPAVVISDHPEFARRGVYLDCSRGKVPTVETLKSLVEQLASWKINELQLYVENVFTFHRHPKIGRGFSPFTPEELLAVQEHGKRHHLRLVPSLSSFGHMERILALPEYTHLGEKPGHLGYPGGTTLCPIDRGSLRLMHDLYDEFLPLFEAVDFNACCDETWELGQGRSRRRRERSGGGRVYWDHVKKLYDLCQRHGKRLNIWSDIVLHHPELVPEIPRDIVMLNWDYDAKGTRIPQTKRFHKAGLPVVVCPGTHGWGSHGTRLHASMDNVRVFAEEGRRCGAAGLLNTDWGDFGHRNTLGVSLHAFAHGAACAWNVAGTDHGAFTDTFCFHFFGRDARGLADAIRALGRDENVAGTSLYYAFGQSLHQGRNLYRGIRPISPVWRPHIHRHDFIGRASEDGCREAMAALAGMKPGKLASRKRDFRSLALADLGLATQMDRLSCRRILAAKRIRTGRNVTQRETKRLQDETRKLLRDFEKVWLARNKPSRLRDNLRLFTNALAEYETLNRD